MIVMDRPRKPIVLKLNPDVVSKNMETLRTIVYAHPELRLELKGFESVLPDLQYICNLNWHGRYLLDRPNVPLSLWSLVLEKANTKADMIYELLKGPAFACRKLK